MITELGQVSPECIAKAFALTFTGNFPTQMTAYRFDVGSENIFVTPFHYKLPANNGVLVCWDQHRYHLPSNTYYGKQYTGESFRIVDESMHTLLALLVTKMCCKRIGFRIEDIKMPGAFYVEFFRKKLDVKIFSPKDSAKTFFHNVLGESGEHLGKVYSMDEGENNYSILVFPLISDRQDEVIFSWNIVQTPNNMWGNSQLISEGPTFNYLDDKIRTLIMVMAERACVDNNSYRLTKLDSEEGTTIVKIKFFPRRKKNEKK